MLSRIFLILLVLSLKTAIAGDPNVTFDPDAPKPKSPAAFEPADDTSRPQLPEAVEVPKPVAKVEPESKPRSKAFTVYKPPPLPPAESDEAVDDTAPAAEASRSVAEAPPAAAAPSGASADSSAVGTMDGPVVSTVLNGEHSPQAARDSMPFLPKIKINGGGTGSTNFKFGH